MSEDIFNPTGMSGARPMKPSDISEALTDAEPTTPASAYFLNHDNATKPRAKPQQSEPTVPAEFYNPFG